jgi:LacI family transcriptional regulator
MTPDEAPAARPLEGGETLAEPPRRPPHKPTLKDIARLAGLAVPTVSRALADAPDIGGETKVRVRRIAADLGYVPNRAGVRLRTGRTNVLSLVLTTEPHMMNNTARLISSLAGELRETPFHLNVTPCFPGEDPSAPIRRIVEMGLADAVIFNQTEPRDPRVAWLLDRGFPFATHGRTDWADRHPWFDYDNAAWGAIGVRRLARAGRRRIAVVAPPVDHAYAGHILQGARAEAARAGARLMRVEGATSDSRIEETQAAVAALLARETPDGFLCASTASALAAVAAIEAAGLRLGREVDVCSKEALPFLQLFRREIITMTEDVGRAGRFLARAAIRAIREPGLPPLQELEIPVDEEAAGDATGQPG